MRLLAKRFIINSGIFFGSPNAGTGMTGVLTHSEERFGHFQIQIGAKHFPEYPSEPMPKRVILYARL